VPGKAMKEYQRALKAEDKGDRQSAIEHLQKAIQIDPEFCAARNDLGANYLFTHHVDLAIEQFNKTIAIDPHAAMPYSNLAVAFLMQNRLADAERAARQEVNLDRGGTRGRLMLGISLVLQQKFTPEAEQSLRKAAADFPQASLMLARVLAAHGEIESARAQLQRYLTSGERSGVEIAKDWMRQLIAVSGR
jgi:Flp pilus assembly protein TadD